MSLWEGIVEGLIIGGLCYGVSKSTAKRTEQIMDSKFSDLIKEAEIKHLREQLDMYQKIVKETTSK